MSIAPVTLSAPPASTVTEPGSATCVLGMPDPMSRAPFTVQSEPEPSTVALAGGPFSAAATDAPSSVKTPPLRIFSAPLTPTLPPDSVNFDPFSTVNNPCGPTASVAEPDTFETVRFEWPVTSSAPKALTASSSPETPLIVSEVVGSTVSPFSASVPPVIVEATPDSGVPEFGSTPKVTAPPLTAPALNVLLLIVACWKLAPWPRSPTRCRA